MAKRRNANRKVVIVKVHEVQTHDITGSHRSSNGWSYETEHKTEAEIWLSVPIIINKECDNLIDFINSRYNHTKYDDDCGLTHIQNKDAFNPEWTKEICVLLNYELSNNTYDFREFSNETADCCHFKLTSCYDFDLKKYIFIIEGKGSLKTPGSPQPYSPFPNIEDLKEGISLMHQSGNRIPEPWIYYLLKYATEDLSGFLSSMSIEIPLQKYKICDEVGEILVSIKNYTCEATTYFYANKPEISYIEACECNCQEAISFYEYWGAHKKYATTVEHKKHSYEDDQEDNESCAQEGQAELDSWEEGWDCNID